MVSVFGFSGDGDVGAPHEIIPQEGDSFTVLDKWLELDDAGDVRDTVYESGDTTLVFSGYPFTWGETYAAAGILHPWIRGNRPGWEQPGSV